MDQQGAQVAVATFADPADALLAATRLNAWRQSQPGGEVPGRLELLAVPHRSDKGRCRHRTHAWRGCKSLADLAGFMPGNNPSFDSIDALAQPIDVVEQATDRRSRLVGQQLRLQLVHTPPQLVHLPDAHANNKAELAKQAARGIDCGRPLPNQKGPDPVQDQDALLLEGLDRHEPHAWPTGGLADGLSVGCVGLVTLDVGFHVLRWDQAHFVAKPNQLPRPMVSTRARLHGDQAARLLGEEGYQRATSQLAPKHGVAGCINAMELKDGFGEVEADRDNGHDGVLLVTWLRWKPARSGNRPGRSMPSNGRFSAHAT